MYCFHLDNYIFGFHAFIDIPLPQLWPIPLPVQLLSLCWHLGPKDDVQTVEMGYANRVESSESKVFEKVRGPSRQVTEMLQLLIK